MNTDYSLYKLFRPEVGKIWQDEPLLEEEELNSTQAAAAAPEAAPSVSCVLWLCPGQQAWAGTWRRLPWVGLYPMWSATGAAMDHTTQTSSAVFSPSSLPHPAPRT